MTVATTIAAVRDILNDEPFEYSLGGSYTAAGATLTISAYASLVEGDILDFAYDGTYEQMRVTATPSTSTVAIKVAHNGTTNANHANAAYFVKNPRFGTQQIVNAITHIVGTRMYPEVWVPTVVTLTPAPTTTNIYDLPADYESFISLVQTATGSIEDIVYVTSIQEVLDVPTGISSSLKALRISAWPRSDAGAALTYRAKVTTSNMTAAMEPVIALGVAGYLLRTESAEKADRLDQDDRPGRMLRSAQALERQFAFEKQQLRTQLLQQWGPVRRFRHARRA